jgi:hypothetical protein
MPVAPKHPGARARRNKSSTAATLTERAPEDVDIPPLLAHPKADDGIDWHPNAKAMWADVWASPMSAEFDDSDIHQMYVLLRLVDMFWTVTSPTAMKDLAAEIRLSGQRFGISPLDRRRLEWQIEATKDAQDRGARRRGKVDPPAPPPTGPLDPRAVLRSVN